MLEQSLRKLFEQQAGMEPPPGRITVAEVLRQGRLRRRRHRISAAGTPVLAAVAAGAIALTGALSSGHLGKNSPQAGSYGKFVRGAFDPSHLAIRFGWLPKGAHVSGGDTSPGEEGISAYSARRGQWGLTAFARDICQMAGGTFQCTPPGLPAQNVPVSGRGPVVAGHRSWWLEGNGHGLSGLDLTWEYGPGAWALLVHERGRNENGATAIVVRIARAAKFGQHVPLRYASRFTSLPSGWRILATYFSAGPDGVGSPPPGEYLAFAYKILKLRTISPTTPVIMGDDTSPNVPYIQVDPAFKGSHGCQHAKGKLVTIHGYRFVVSDVKYTKHRNFYSVGCGNVDGLAVGVNEISAAVHPNWSLSPVQVLKRMQLLGADPSHWVTNPMP